MLKIRTSAVGSNEYLKFEEMIRDGVVVYDKQTGEPFSFRITMF
ncbi:MAG: hypothetical protein ACRKFN_12155 [Desulfitobacterium sp.]